MLKLITLKGKVGRSTSESYMQGLRKKGKQITVQSISLTMTLKGNTEGDTAEGRLGTNIKGIQISFYGNRNLKCLILPFSVINFGIL